MILDSVVLTNPVVVGLLAAAALCWMGWLTAPDPARRRTALLVPVPSRTSTEPPERNSRGLLSRRQNPAPGPDHVAAELPGLVEVMSVAVASGLSITASLQLALGHHDGGTATGRWLAALTSGPRPLDEALDEFGASCGARARAFASAVTGSMRTGVPLAAELDRLQRELRDDVRRRLERRVRRLPVLLLFPLVFCVLPALGLIAIVPVLAAAFGG
ncbi:type II secretion system F family protein [Candidatus Poriferisodalis sp.]|uniref:type II secretion system F family protein n=1 Tax=Candidatus Poriferisodalis sp. TaxID=3101277 RepID=UPI003B02177E